MSPGWERVGIADLENRGAVQLGRGKVISKIDLANAPGNYPVYSSAKENDGKFGEYGEYMFDEELITWSVDGGGRLFHRSKHRFSITNVGGYIRILEPDVVDCRYLFHVLIHLHGQVQFDWVRKAHPSVIRQVYTEFPLPPLDEQKRIVAVLDQAFAALDRARANAEANLADAQDVFQRTLDSEFFALAGNAPLRPLQDAVHRECGLSYGIVQPGDDFEDGLPIVRPVDLKEREIRLPGLKRIAPQAASGYARTTLRGGELLLCVRGSTGTVSVAGKDLAGANVTRGIVPIRFDDGKVLRDFAYFQFQSASIRQQIAKKTYGAALMQINIKDLRTLHFFVPIIEEQQQIVEMSEKLDEASKSLKRSYEDQVADINILRQSLLHAAFSGQLT